MFETIVKRNHLDLRHGDGRNFNIQIYCGSCTIQKHFIDIFHRCILLILNEVCSHRIDGHGDRENREIHYADRFIYLDC